MPKYIVILDTARELSPEHYPTLFGFLESLPRGVHFKSGVMAIDLDDEPENALKRISEHLGKGDDISIFQICGAAWHLDRQKDGSAHDHQLRAFLETD